MNDDVQREMTLDEWCGKLAKHHRANKELRELKEAYEAPEKQAPFGLLERFGKWLGRLLFTDNYAYQAVAIMLIMVAMVVFAVLGVITNFGF